MTIDEQGTIDRLNVIYADLTDGAARSEEMTNTTTRV
jgi:hypothetical protein